MNMEEMEVEAVAALLLSLGASLIILLRSILVLNLWPPSALQLVTGVAISFASGTLFWVSIAAVKRPLLMQVTASAVGTGLHWTRLTLVVNDSLRLPTRQQWTSLAFYLVTDLSFMLQARLLLA